MIFNLFSENPINEQKTYYADIKSLLNPLKRSIFFVLLPKVVCWGHAFWECKQ